MSMSVEEMALAEYTVYWEQEGSWLKYETRWNKLQSNIHDKEARVVNEMVRNACIEMFKAGFMLRLTGE